MGKISGVSDSASVLIVEDECLIAMDIELMVTGAGYRVVGPAASVETALAIAERDRPDVALLDVRIIGGLSYPVAERLAADGVPFAFLTSTSAGDIPAAFAGSPLVQKPMSSDAVLGVVEALVARRRAAVART